MVLVIVYFKGECGFDFQLGGRIFVASLSNEAVTRQSAASSYANQHSVKYKIVNIFILPLQWKYE